MDEQEREFARNQTDIQILLAITLGFLALAAAVLIAYVQLCNDAFAALTVVFVIFGIVTSALTINARKKMDEPKEAKTKLQNSLMQTAKRDTHLAN
jgi:membrane protein implicated in regulation of membrane protease activity